MAVWRAGRSNDGCAPVPGLYTRFTLPPGWGTSSLVLRCNPGGRPYFIREQSPVLPMEAIEGLRAQEQLLWARSGWLRRRGSFWTHLLLRSLSLVFRGCAHAGPIWKDARVAALPVDIHSPFCGTRYYSCSHGLLTLLLKSVFTHL